MDYANVRLEKKGHVALLTLAHPPANAFDLATMRDFDRALDEVVADPEARALVITGDGDKCFSAGFDVSDAANQHVTGPLGRETWTKLDGFEKPVIAAMNGHALGGGLELSLCCHFRLATDNPRAMLGLTELNLGLIPGWGGTQRLPRAVGRDRALDMILFSRRLTTGQALEMGLVHKVFPADRLLAEALAFAAVLAERPPVAVACVLKAMHAGGCHGLERGLAVEAEGSARVRETEDRAEGFAAFLEKRKPVFKGR
ncbi:MAG: enoyl-CoA hydratase/isomerase family protein [Proteobacteria bacterium]|nr:enoyl-CoA hydratase/isomerase family protein [Pseudomonadota bacterium]